MQKSLEILWTGSAVFLESNDNLAFIEIGVCLQWSMAAQCRAAGQNSFQCRFELNSKTFFVVRKRDSSSL